ncbi:MAG: dehydratase [Acidobacteriota bacterium]|nr:dehydratase [Acidobacteriota bacterium]
MNPVIFDDLDQLLGAAPLDLGGTDWSEVTGEEIDRFEAATGGPVSPYLALSLTNRFLPSLLAVPGASSGVNYGTEGARFGPPLAPGDRIRVKASLQSSAAVAGGVQTVVEIRVEVEGAEPACVVQSVSRWLR